MSSVQVAASHAPEAAECWILPVRYIDRRPNEVGGSRQAYENDVVQRLGTLRMSENKHAADWCHNYA
jgi:hypothetical protein